MSQFITLKKPVFSKVKDLRPGQKGFNVYLKVVEVNFESATRTDGSKLEIADALCGDETGVVRVRVIGENAPKFQQGKVVSFRNGRSEVFKERMRLELDRWGKVQEEKDIEIKEVNKTQNLSDVQYEVKVVKVDRERGGEGRDFGGESRGYRGGRGRGFGGRRGNARRGPGGRRDDY